MRIVDVADVPDDDYTDPTVPIPGYAGEPGTLIAPTDPDGSFNPAVSIAWSIPPRRMADGSPTKQVKIKVTLRDSAGDEVAGTWSATAFSLVQRDDKEGKASSRPAVEWLGEIVNQPTKKPAILDVAACEAMGLIFTAISGGDFAYVYLQEWG